MVQDPRQAHPRPPQPTQQQQVPGHTGEMTPRPDHGEASYRGCGRLEGKEAQPAQTRQRERADTGRTDEFRRDVQ